MSSKYPLLHILDRRWLGLVGQDVPRRDALWETAGIRYEKVVWMPLDVYGAYPREIPVERGNDDILDFGVGYGENTRIPPEQRAMSRPR